MNCFLQYFISFCMRVLVMCVLYVATVYEEARRRFQVSCSTCKEKALWNFHKYAKVLCSYVFPFFVLFCRLLSSGQTNCPPLAYFHIMYISLLSLALLLKILISLLRILYLVLWHNILMLISLLENKNTDKSIAYTLTLCSYNLV